MAFGLLLFISLLTYNTGFSAEISVFVQTGDSVQLDIQTQELPEFVLLSWTNKLDNIVMYLRGTKEVQLHPSYKDRVYFNDETFSLTLKNMQKTDSGLYTAKTSGFSNKYIAAYSLSVIDAVEAPVLTVNSNWSSSDPCSFTCKGSNITVSSIYNSSSCSPEEVTSSDNYTLTLNCSGDYITCNHSNPVSWKTEIKKVNELCTVDPEMPEARRNSMNSSWLILFICLLTTSLLASVISWCLYKRKKDHSYTPDQQNEPTVYEKVGENINPQRPLEMLEKSKNPSTVYDTLREHGTPEVTLETNQTSRNHDTVNQSATLTEKSQPNAPVTIYSTIEKQTKSETDHTIYAAVSKQPAGDESVHPKLENIKPQKSLEMLEKSENPQTVYDTTGESEQPDVTMETNQTSPNHDSVNQLKQRL
ncbi:SLAM family member 9-like [Megalobrama amblycephala]|uniref:SLAM family member 9-like n=1 Tax=Megalobrama amblycephala TaxID=75352 RepID=UPI002013E1FF|nr:SLAM family member 9-like [Megalobrama amblycephala]